MQKLSDLKLKLPMSWKTYVQVIGLLLVLTAFVYYGGTATVNLTLEARVADLENLSEEMRRLTIEEVIGSSFYPMQKPCGYLISKVGSYTCMQSGTTGKLDAYSTNASQIGRWVYGNLSSGGSVFWKAGDYEITYQIEPTNNTRTFGEGKATRLYLPDSQPLVAQYHQIFALYNCENVTIEHLCVDGNYLNNDYIGSQALIRIVNSRHVDVQFCYVINARIFGVYVVGTAGHDVYDVNVCHNDVIECKWNGISYYSMHETSLVHDCLTTHNYVKGSCDIGLDTFAGDVYALITPYRIEFSHNIINCTGVTGYGSGEGDSFFGIRLEAGHSHLVSDNICFGNGIGDGIYTHNNTYVDNIVWMTSENCSAGMFLYMDNNVMRGNRIYGGYRNYCIGINIRGNNNIIESNYIVKSGSNSNFGGIHEHPDYDPNGTVIRNNEIIGCDNYAIGLGEGNNQLIEGNIVLDCNAFLYRQGVGSGRIYRGNVIDYKPCENFVSSTNTTATTFVFNHGLAGTPDFVFCSFNTTAITGWSWTATSTQITVTVTGSSLPEIMAVYCQAIYEP